MARTYIPIEIQRLVRAAAQNRCGYCLSPQHLVMARLEIEHIIPISQGGSNDESNLWLACPICNRHKSDKTTAVDSETTVLALHLSDDPDAIEVRSYWVQAGWHPPED